MARGSGLDAGRRRDWQHVLAILYNLLSTRTEGSPVVFSITLFPPMMSQRQILSNESFEKADD